MKEERERRLVLEYVREKFPDRKVVFNAPIGPLPAAATAAASQGINPRIFNKVRRYADALVMLPGENVIIEAKVEDELGAVAQLMYYRREFRDTPEFQERKDLPVRTLLVVSRENFRLGEFARENGIEMEFYRPAWILPYLRQRRLIWG